MTLQLLQAQWDVAPCVKAFSTTRVGGSSLAAYDSLNVALHVGDDPLLVAKNRELIAEKFSADLEWQWLDQVHSSEAASVVEVGSPPRVDALYTIRSNVVCCVQTADCLPLFVAAKDGAEVAVIHAGWKGLSERVVENTIEAMVSPASDLAVWLGPAIGPCHFEVGAEVREAFLARSASASASLALEQCFSPNGKADKFMADLYALARIKLRTLGVSSVGGGDGCTFCDSEKFYSYRRDGATGRMLHAIYIEA